MKGRLVTFWLVAGIVVWNGVFDVLMSRGVKDYLFREAAHELGRGEHFTMREIMDETVEDAALTASIWATLIAGAGLVTVVLASRHPAPRTPQAPGTPGAPGTRH